VLFVGATSASTRASARLCFSIVRVSGVVAPSASTAAASARTTGTGSPISGVRDAGGGARLRVHPYGERRTGRLLDSVEG